MPLDEDQDPSNRIQLVEDLAAAFTDELDGDELDCLSLAHFLSFQNFDLLKRLKSSIKTTKPIK